MKRIALITLWLLGIYAYAQTPFDSFAPEVSPPITDNIRKWLSVDPLADKYPNITPYAYCNWNPVKYVDQDGREPNKALAGTADDFKKLLDYSKNKVGTIMDYQIDQTGMGN